MIGPHGYAECMEAEEFGCGFEKYKVWREGIDLREYEHCWKCGLSQKICRRLEDDGWCEYAEIMLPGIFVYISGSIYKASWRRSGFKGITRQMFGSG